MSEISVGPEPAQQLDAQQANEADTHHGEAGAEAKPFAQRKEGQLPPRQPGDSQMPPDEPNDMISERRHAGRDEAGDVSATVSEQDN